METSLLTSDPPAGDGTPPEGVLAVDTISAGAPDLVALSDRLLQAVPQAAVVEIDPCDGPAGLRVLARLVDAADDPIGHADCLIDPAGDIAMLNDIELDHRYRGDRIGPAIMLATLTWLCGEPIRELRFVANREHGAYAWARCGFRPTPESWPAVARRIDQAIDAWGDRLPPAVTRLLRRARRGPAGMADLIRIRVPAPWSDAEAGGSGDGAALLLPQAILAAGCRYDVVLDLTDFRSRSEIVRHLRARLADD